VQNEADLKFTSR